MTAELDKTKHKLCRNVVTNLRTSFQSHTHCVIDLLERMHMCHVLAIHQYTKHQGSAPLLLSIDYCTVVYYTVVCYTLQLILDQTILNCTVCYKEHGLCIYVY